MKKSKEADKASLHATPAWRTDLAITAALAAIFLACVVVFRMPDDDRMRVSNPQSIRDLSTHIGRVEGLAEDTLEIVLDQPTPTYDASALTDLAKSALVISRGLQMYFSEERGTTIRFVARMPATGIERFVTSERVLAVEFWRSDLMGLDYDGEFQFQDLLNISKGVVYDQATDRRYVEAFCADPIATAAAAFCQRERR
ncbi:hypothetical protein QTI33_18825 [Variovorax sp. J22P271]|uniref:hypothetical protein n=1 Tax=Variovorax davisae TaxID=3053515 RepID=UPI002578A289|nr:hypothetical protein [Variovorax sp. J22P271]MDM0034195.1 hypothetical protein [Variovorax sp. J22P271]